METAVNDQDIITFEPDKRGGQPCIRGLRITVSDILSYLAWLSRGVPVGEGGSLPGSGGLPAMIDVRGDTARSRGIYAAKCASCHQLNGEGNPAIPHAGTLHEAD